MCNDNNDDHQDDHQDDNGDADDENVDGDDNDDDDDDSNAVKTIIKELIEYKRSEALKRKESRFIPATKKYLKSSFIEKTERITPNVVNNLLDLCENIVSVKYLSIYHVLADEGLMRHILDKSTPHADVKLFLIEDWRLHFYFHEALDILEKHGRRLTLIDAKKFNSLMELLEHSAKRQKIVDEAKQPCEEAELVDSYKDMISSVQNKSSLAGTNIVNDMRKKAKFQDSMRAAAPPAVAAAANPPTLNIKPGTVAESEKRIKDFLKAKGVKNTKKGIGVGGNKTIAVSYEDMIFYLTHNFNKNNANLTEDDTIKVLRLLKATRMPANYIRNKHLYSRYKEILATGSRSGGSGGSASGFQTPARPRPPVTSKTDPYKHKHGVPRDFMTEGYLQSHEK